MGAYLERLSHSYSSTERSGPSQIPYVTAASQMLRAGWKHFGYTHTLLVLVLGRYCSWRGLVPLGGMAFHPSWSTGNGMQKTHGIASHQ